VVIEYISQFGLDTYNIQTNLSHRYIWGVLNNKSADQSINLRFILTCSTLLMRYQYICQFNQTNSMILTLYDILIPNLESFIPF